MTPTVVLFDIDGTLVTCGGAGRRAMERAFVDAVGDASVADFGFGGMTDRAIARQGLVRAGRSPTEEQLDALLERYLGYLADELPRSPGYRVLAGVERVLDALDVERTAGAPIAVGLGTGNLVRGARLKLEPGGLWERFGFGGYGSDDEDRPRLLETGARRGAGALGIARETARVVIVGDTPRDVHAAHAIGAVCVAVASGTYDLAALAACGPARACPSLAEVALDDLLG
jgi:phosphoglycolate phosphatase-like HAD superfamily hydrolase